MIHDIGGMGTNYSASADQAANTVGRSYRGGELDRTAFLQLLVTELKNQNPMDPVDNKEFIAQLAQFSALEGVQNLREAVDGLSSIEQGSADTLRQMSDMLRQILGVQQEMVGVLRGMVGGTSLGAAGNGAAPQA